MKNSHKIVITGGHAATTALAVIQEIKARKLDWDLYFIGAESAMEGTKVATFESDILPKYRIVFLPVKTGRLQRKFTVWTIPSILKIPAGLFKSFGYLSRIKPDLVLSFGGYVSVPVVVASKILGIPVIVHEQTAAAGRANRTVATLVDKILLARNESKKYFPSKKTLVVGNPITREIILANHKKHGIQKEIFVTGGSRGSQSINDAVGVILLRLLSKYVVVHQTGELDLPKYEKIKKELPADLFQKYTVFSRIFPDKAAKIYAASDLVISRAGANTVSDILAAQIPAILIPLPISYLDEQTKNAKYAEKLGEISIIDQSKLTPDLLFKKIEELLSPGKISAFKKAANNPDLTAAGKTVDIIARYLK